MSKSKKVAIIGAGPSGLAAANSLIHDHPPGTFAPIIYEKLSHVGGIWPVCSDDHANVVSPDMPTNASKHIVSFSDLAWDSVKVAKDKQPGQDIATFPRAHEVGRYLQTYADKYIPPGSIRFGTEVVSISPRNGAGLGWDVTACASTDTRQAVSERFDHVIVASGFFAAPEMPRLHGLETFRGPVIHSSELRDVEKLISKVSAGQKVVVIGGSLSGGEAAATLAFHLSSLQHRPGISPPGLEKVSVHHVTPRPFWSVPPYVPVDPSLDSTSNPSPIFLPLDILLSDLSGRSGDSIHFVPSSTFASKDAKVFNGVLRSLVGGDQSQLGDGALAITTSGMDKPPWLIISTPHTEFVRSGHIKVVVGRATGLKGNTMTLVPTVGEHIELADVGMIVMATGFTPHPALSFLSPDIQQMLGYDPSNSYDPIKLFNCGTMHPSIPSLGFVGFYRGPYFGVLEQQSRFLGALWSESLHKIPEEPPGSVENIGQRGQFPMGDYVGLMESFAAILGTGRQPLSPKHSSREGPAIPARYTGQTTSRNHSAAIERTKSCAALVKTLAQPSLFTAPAVFRALQGKWNLQRTVRSANPTYPSGVFTGEANMYPRQPTAAGYAAEFLYVEKGQLVTDQGLEMAGSRSYVYRLSEFEPQMISAWFVKPLSGSKEVDYIFHELEFTQEPVDKEKHAWSTGWRAQGTHHLCIEDHYDASYWFHMHAIDMERWSIGYTVKGPSKDYWTRATYVR